MSDDTTTPEPNAKLIAYRERVRAEAQARAEADAASWEAHIQRLFRQGAEEQARERAGPNAITINGRTFKVKRARCI